MQMASLLTHFARCPVYQKRILGKGLLNLGCIQQRELWGMLNSVFNKPDRERIKEVGPDRACAEWLLRCGAHVRWRGSEKFHTDYNTLPQFLSKGSGGGPGSHVIEEINGDEAAVMHIGFPHFVGVNHVKKIRFHRCMYLTDDAVAQLNLLRDSLEHLEISSCGDVSDDGLKSLTELSLLQTLLLYDLPEVRHKQTCYDLLCKALPQCTIDYKDLKMPKAG